MEKRKIKFDLFALLFIALLGLGFASCSDDDDDSSLAGTMWVLSDSEGDDVLMFTSNKSGIEYFHDREDDDVEKYPFTYSYNASKKEGKIFDDEARAHTFFVNGNVLNIYDDDGELGRFYKGNARDLEQFLE